MRRRLNLVLMIISMVYLLFGLLPVGVSAQTEAPPAPTPSDDDVNAIASQMYCPVCENIPLDQCSTQACYEWRELIRQKLAEGKTTEQIKEYFAQQYGDNVLSEPPRRGLNWLVYLLPPVALILGGVILYLSLVRRSKVVVKKLEETVPGVESENDPYIVKLEEELKKREHE
jgi:cytochrome c-type biogenesis protein CcmH